jgi:hypothetical protein
MKPTEIKKSILSLNKKSISNLSTTDMKQVNGGFAMKPPVNNTTTILETVLDCPCTHFCVPETKTTGSV